MVLTEDILKSVLKFDDDEFFNLDQTLLLPRELEFLEMDYSGIVINGPKRIIWKEKESLPLVIAIRRSGERDWSLKIKKNCFIIASNLENGDVIIDRALTTKKDDYYSFQDQDDDSDRPIPDGVAGDIAQLTTIDINNKISFDRNFGKWSFSLLYYNWKSNSIVVDIVGEDQVNTDFIPSPFPGPNLDDITALPSYVPIQQTPEMPESGLSFHLQAMNKDGKPMLNLFGSFSLKARSIHIPESAILYEFNNGHKEKVAAVIPITCLLVKKNNILPLKIDLYIPVYGNTIGENELVRGQFGLDIISSAEMEEIILTEYVCYLVMDGSVYGPKIVQLF